MSATKRLLALLRELPPLLRISLPIFMGMACNSLVGFTDVVVAGQYSRETLASASIGATIYWTFFIAVIGFVSLYVPRIANRFGAGDWAGLRTLFYRMMCLLGIGAAVVLLFAYFPIAHYLIPLLHYPKSVREAASQYIGWMSIGFVPLCIQVGLVNLASAMQRAKIASVVGVISLATNVPLDILLTFGVGPFPEMGASGLAIASSIAMTVNAVVALLYIARLQRHYKIGLRFHLPKIDFRALFHEARSGLLIAGSRIMELALFSATPLIGSSGLSVADVAADRVLGSYASLFFIFPFSMGMAANTRIGYLCGKGASRRSPRVVQTAFLFSLCVMAAPLLLFLFAPELPLSLVTRDPLVWHSVQTVLIAAALVFLFDGTQGFFNQVIYAFEAAKEVAIIGAVGFILFGVGISVFLFFVFHLGLLSFWIGMASGVFSVAALMIWRYIHHQDAFLKGRLNHLIETRKGRLALSPITAQGNVHQLQVPIDNT